MMPTDVILWAGEVILIYTSDGCTRRLEVVLVVEAPITRADLDDCGTDENPRQQLRHGSIRARLIEGGYLREAVYDEWND